jgi:chromosome segregation ATPase
MIRRVIVYGGGGLLLLGLALGTGVWSYVRTSAGYVTDAVHEAVPVDFQLRRAGDMIEALDGPIRENRKRIAWEEVKVKRLEKQIEEAQDRLDTEKSQIMRLKGDLASAQEEYRYAGRTFTAEQVRTDLANRFERYKTGEETLATLAKIHQAREKGLAAALQKLESMEATKRQLEVEVENLEARVEMLAAVKAADRYEFNDGQLGRVKQLVSDLETRLDVADQMLAAETRIYDEIPLDEADPSDIIDQVSQYFEQPEPEAGDVAMD